MRACFVTEDTPPCPPLYKGGMGGSILVVASRSDATLGMFRWQPAVAIVAEGLFVAVGLALLGILAASVWNLLQKRWAVGFVNLLLMPVCGAASVFVLGYYSRHDISRHSR